VSESHVFAGPRSAEPVIVGLVADAWAIKRDPLGLGPRLAHHLTQVLDVSVALQDLSGPGGIGGAYRRASQVGVADVNVILLGVEDAPKDPSPSVWLDAYVALWRLLRPALVVIPPPIIAGVHEVPGWSTKAARKWSRKIPGLVVERLAHEDDLHGLDLRDMDDGFRADDAWLKPSGHDWVAEEIARAIATMGGGRY